MNKDKCNMYHIGIKDSENKSCYFAKVCDRVFNKKHIWVNIFSLQLSVHEYRLTICVKRAQNLYQDVLDKFLKIPG